MRQRAHIRKPRRTIDASPRTGVYDDSLAFERASPAAVERHLDRLGRDKATLAHDQLGATFLVFLQVHCDEAVNHLPLALADRGHIDFDILCGNAELAA